MNEKTSEEIVEDIMLKVLNANHAWSDQKTDGYFVEAIRTERAAADELRKENEKLKTTLASERLARQTKAV